MSFRKFISGPAGLRALLPAVFLFVAGCAENYSQSTLAPKSDFTRMIDGLFMTTVWWAVVVFVLVEGTLVFAIIRFRGKPDDPEPRQTHGNTTVEIVWTIIPAVILALIAVPTIRTIFRTAEVPAGALTIEVIGHQWWWEFRYPDQQVVTANEMHIPVGRTVALKIITHDVLHSFWLPQLAAKRDAFPRRYNTLWFKAEEAGDYTGQCAEFCGIQHGRMGFKVIADEPAEFEAWAASEQVGSPMVNAGAMPAGAVAAPDSVMEKGKATFLAGGCIGCHAMGGTPTGGVMTMVGPNLTHVGSRTTLVANLMPNTDENLARWLRDPQAVKEGSLMKLPRKLTEEEVQTLVAYLRAHK